MKTLTEPATPASTESEYDKLAAAAARLRRSQRGQAALQNLSNFFRDGGTGLDAQNQQAAAQLFYAAMTHPWDLPAELTKGGAS